MKFIFPQNYDFSSKILGIIEYPTAILDAVWSGLVLLIINLIFHSLSTKVVSFIILVLPVLIFSIVGVNGENIISVSIYLIKFIIRPKVIIYDKDAK